MSDDRDSMAPPDAGCPAEMPLSERLRIGRYDRLPSSYIRKILIGGRMTGEQAYALAQVVRGRGEDGGWSVELAVRPTCHCGRVGLYRVGRVVFCRVHRDDARTAPGGVRYRAGKDRAHDETAATIRRVDQLATARGRFHASKTRKRT